MANPKSINDESVTTIKDTKDTATSNGNFNTRGPDVNDKSSSINEKPTINLEKNNVTNPSATSTTRISNLLTELQIENQIKMGAENLLQVFPFFFFFF